RLVFQTVALAFVQLTANKFRALLTTLGIIIGVSAVIATGTATNGLKGYVLQVFDSFGPRKVWMDGTVPRKLRGRVRWQEYDLTLKEVLYLKEHAQTIDAITPMHFVNGQVRAGDEYRDGVNVQGIWPDWHEIEKRTVTSGRPFIQVDVEEMRNVCLINDKGIEELALPSDPVGDFVIINNRRFLIVGVIETKQVAAMLPGGGETKTEVYIPISTALAIQPRLGVAFALAQLKDVSMGAESKAEISAILRRLRGLSGEDENTFQVETVQSVIDQVEATSAVITGIALGLVAVSLLVGGVGIMNIMLVSVSERTREIGLRKAVGARPGVILLQFLVEATVLCLIGGVVGVLLAGGVVTGAKMAFPKLGEFLGVPMWTIVVSVVFSAAVGIIFGMFPAIKAARLDPIVALRHE
ncbi:MAG TPA: ABC transporter permease, partial [Phycisphaerales bacterium]|nr:ABC transporter permease [Phycisphaerales bacterium]